MFNDFAAFYASFQHAWPEKNVDQAQANAYYGWYLNARSQNKIVLGREKDLQSLKDEYGLAEEGGRMLIGVKTWDIVVNDSWILGGIHAQSPFLLKTVLTFDSVYNVEQKNNPDQTRVMYVTTREIAGLNLFGYKKDKEDADGQLFLCTEKTPAAMRTSSPTACTPRQWPPPHCLSSNQALKRPSPASPTSAVYY